MTATGLGVADLAEFLGRVPGPEPAGTVPAGRLQAVAGGLDRLAEACGDVALIHDARVLAAAARRAGRDFTAVLTRLGQATQATDSGRSS